jgi:hypothetical protein
MSWQIQITLRSLPQANNQPLPTPRWERLSSDPGMLPAPADVQFHRIPNIAGAYGFAVEFNHRETLTTLFFRRG